MADLEKWECAVCKKVYDSRIGDLEHSVKPGTCFDGSSGDWVCPVWGVPKDQFVNKE